ncbi:hypothetical protein LAZ67_2000599 [Cordylochernes scorpioides]|uniref:Reverse transcriptase domain-containing protein n=1 Tax=Cordylochernes scorpioides TaxID=51811 RepID=A0ABY6K0L6_9ARAC|nr:hypothetical protein LAZ67_2000599 [Cordylochernes scorpioides]
MYVAVMYGGVVDVERVARGLHMLVNEGLGILTGNIAGMFSHPDGYRSTRLTDRAAHSAYIYGLPKIHKPEVPLRPIIAYHLSPAYPLAKYLSSFLSPLLTNYNNTLSINSTPHFINELTALKPDPAYTMCSFDVTSLYLCLPHQLITDGLTHFLQSQNVDSHTSSTIVQLTKTCLSMNTFSFLQHHYRQFRGSPMGSPLSTIIAEIVMTRIDNWITHTLPTDIQFWRRYIDDVFCICKRGFILSTLNNYNQDISFTLETETNHVLPFLDILIIRTPSSFHTTVYHKKQCPPCYTHYNSHCPTSHKIKIVRTLTKRISTHCSIDIFKIIERNRIITQLSMASFPLWFINKYTYTPASSNPSMTYRSLCFLPYSPSSVDIARKLKSYGIRTIYKNSPNLLSSLRHPHTKSSAPPAPLRSVGAVYSVSCEQCPATYVGETGRSVSIRMTEHSRNISRQDTKSLIYQHMQTTGHTFNINNPTIHYSHIHILHQRLILESIDIIGARYLSYSRTNIGKGHYHSQLALNMFGVVYTRCSVEENSRDRETNKLKYLTDDTPQRYPSFKKQEDSEKRFFYWIYASQDFGNISPSSVQAPVEGQLCPKTCEA